MSLDQMGRCSVGRTHLLQAAAFSVLFALKPGIGALGSGGRSYGPILTVPQPAARNELRQMKHKAARNGPPLALRCPSIFLAYTPSRTELAQRLATAAPIAQSDPE